VNGGSKNPRVVSVIVVDGNSRRFLEDCLISLAVLTFSNRKSSWSTAVLWFLKREISRFIELGENRGFSGGNLVGLNAAKGEFIAL
jgi:GT2 family glycosyltransferase